MNCFRAEKVHSSEGGHWKEWHIDCLFSSSPDLSNIMKCSFPIYLQDWTHCWPSIWKTSLLWLNLICAAHGGQHVRFLSSHPYLDTNLSIQIQVHHLLDLIFQLTLFLKNSAISAVRKDFFVVVFLKRLKATIPKRIFLKVYTHYMLHFNTRFAVT